ncbi:MAG: hypothetical protein HY423_12380, partial [Candidatus Lambdaproteobacteria bacterium]|nr:hypothetical protein [Candidatus Lambdaproteobacteria bacterium]
MEALSGSERVPPPWNALGLDSAESLREAQEYFFQTHATNARLIAEGRNAQGFMKMAVRRKLSKEIGEDFKMYTGQAIGEASESAESVGIRGELNVMIKTVYQKIAPTTPITSPTQEDSTILSHPLGALEVVYDMVYFYTSLLKKYATLAGNRRKTLKSVLDEELFKWIWRLTCTYLLAPAEKRSTFTQAIPSVGLAFIPAERQRVPSAEKILDIGKFLLGKTMMESHLRFSLCYYYVTFVRQLQYELLAQPPKIPPEPSYEAIKRHRPDQLVENPLVAVDVLMNFSGNSMQSFDDVLKDEANEIQKYIPPNEIEFIQQFQEFTPERLKHSLQRFLPKVSAAAMPEDPTGTLMPMLLLLRTMRFITRQLVLEHIPGPYLSLLINRSQHGGIDEVEKPLVDLLKEVTVGRQRKGEQYTLTTRIKGSVEVQPPGESATAARAPAAAPAAAPAPARPAAGGAPAARPAPAAAAADAGAWFQGRVILAWRVEKGKVEVFSISGADMAATAGAD